MLPFPELSHICMWRASTRAIKTMMSFLLMITGLSSECFETLGSGNLVCLCIIIKLLIGIMVTFYAINLLLSVECQKSSPCQEHNMFPALRNWEYRKRHYILSYKL